MPNGQRQGGAGRLGDREPVILSPPRVAVPPIRVTRHAQPLRDHNRERIQGVAQRSSAAPRSDAHMDMTRNKARRLELERNVKSNHALALGYAPGNAVAQQFLERLGFPCPPKELWSVLWRLYAGVHDALTIIGG